MKLYVYEILNAIIMFKNSFYLILMVFLPWQCNREQFRTIRTGFQILQDPSQQLRSIQPYFLHMQFSSWVKVEFGLVTKAMEYSIFALRWSSNYVWCTNNFFCIPFLRIKRCGLKIYYRLIIKHVNMCIKHYVFTRWLSTKIYILRQK